jgi:hypothetical protein
VGRLLDQIKLILLQDDKRERRRLLLKLQQDTKRGSGELSFMHEGMLSATKNPPNLLRTSLLVVIMV